MGTSTPTLSQELPGEYTPSVPEHHLLRLIAAGAYGEVWLARNAVGTFRAVKIVRRDQHTSIESFEREFKGLQRFEPVSRSHEGLVDILTLGLLPEDAGFYYVMELADDLNPECKEQNPERQAVSETNGICTERYAPKTLRAALKASGALPGSEVIALGLKLADALRHLNSQGLVHRDIKPSNILFVGGEPKLADAGLVAPVDEAQSLVGTAGYIAPEGPGTPQADIYALGKVLYEATFERDRQEFPALPPDVASRADHALLLEINEVIAKACAPNPRQRYETATRLRADLELLHRGKSVRQGHAWARGWKIAVRVGAVASVFALVAAGILFAKREARSDRPRSSDPEALILYDQAKGLLNQLSLDSAVLAYRKLADAVKRDPRFLDAYYLMVECYFSRAGDQLAPRTNHLANLRWVAEKMRSINPESAQYHTAMACINQEEWKFEEAISHLESALRADGNFLRAHSLLGGLLLRARGDPDSSLLEFKAAEQLNGADAVAQTHLGTPYYVKGDYANAIKHYKEALSLGRNSGPAKELIALAYEASGEYAKALDWYEQDEEDDPEADKEKIKTKYELRLDLLQKKGINAVWEAMLEERRDWHNPYALAEIHARLGHTKEALDGLNQAFREHQGAMTELLMFHYWRPFDHNPDFQEIVKRVGLKPKG